jgi:hypothetical protein
MARKPRSSEVIGPTATMLLGKWLQLALENGWAHKHSPLCEDTLQAILPGKKITPIKGGLRAIKKLLHDTAG